MKNPYINYNFHYIPTKFVEDQLFVSDAMGYICSSSFHFDRETYNNNLIMYVLSGTLYVEQYAQTHVLKAGQSILMRLTDHHNYYSDKDDVAHIIWFHFRGNIFTPLMSKLFDHNCLPYVAESNNIANLIYQCFDITSERAADFEYELSCAVFNAVMNLMKRPLYQIEQKQTRQSSWFAVQIEEYVNDHIYEHISLDSMSQFMNMSKFHFSRIFSHYFKLSPIQYVLRKKIQHSKKLLSETNEKIEDIAHALDFSDQSHYSKVFKNLEGITPLSYRMMTKNSKE